MIGTKREGDQQRIKYNRELSKYLRTQRLQWVDYVQGMDGTGILEGYSKGEQKAESAEQIP